MLDIRPLHYKYVQAENNKDQQITEGFVVGAYLQHLRAGEAEVGSLILLVVDRSSQAVYTIDVANSTLVYENRALPDWLG